MGRLSSGVLAAAAVLTAVVTVQPVQAADAQPPLPDTTDDAFNKECLDAHNQYRIQHGAPPLALDDAVIAHARQRAQAASAQNAASRQWQSSQGYGENHFWFATLEDEPASCEEAVRQWHEARWTGGYDWNRPGYSPETATFTQLVWKDTDVLGCGRASGTRSDSGAHQTFIVCAYSPAGNISGRFPDNVGAPVGG